MKSRNIILLTVVSVWVIGISFLWVSINYNQVFEHKVQFGNQLWSRTMGDVDDPFEEVKLYYANPIQVKDGYVLYESWKAGEIDNKYRTSRSLNSFTRAYDYEGEFQE